MNRNVQTSKTAEIQPRKKRKFPIFQIINGTILILFSLLCLYPFFNLVLTSFSSQGDYLNSFMVVIPRHFNIEAYKQIFIQGNIGRAFLLSVFVTVAGTLYSMVLTALGAYAMTKRDLVGRKVFFIFIFITMFFSGGLIPFFLTVKDLGLYDNIFSLFIPFGINTFNMIILRNFFAQVPQSVVESCKLVGANDFTILWRFILPLSKAGLATIALFYLVERWNDWYWPMIFTGENLPATLAYELRNILSQKTTDASGSDPTLLYQQGREAATIIVALLPIVAVYPFIQKYFVKGVMLGAVKA